MIARLLELAKWVREAKKHGQDLGLDEGRSRVLRRASRERLGQRGDEIDQLRLMARELAEMVREMPKLDWTERELVRAGLRRSVRRLLAKYGYPLDLSEDATQLVLKQAELSTAEVDES